MIVADTSVVYSLLDDREPRHDSVVEWYGRTTTVLATTPLVIAEIDHLAGARRDPIGRSAWRRDLRSGAFDVIWWDEAIATTIDVAEQYRDLGVDLADASLVALSDRLSTVEIATLDERHFRAMRPLSGGPAFRLLPVDA